ncbi:MAG: SAM-dependent methyltransferase [Bacteroidota bacterium]|nr:SAM-dependent methyltransferase [Bacteroidota bacterium]
MPSVYGKLFLLPVPIADGNDSNYIPAYNFEIVKQLTHFIAEDAKTARRFLKYFNYPNIQAAQITELNEHTKPISINELIQPLLKGQNVGLMSDAGCPGIADPGAEVVKLAHQHNIEVAPLVGPSSIVLSIMASGFTGQNFAFVGYLPIEKDKKIKRLKELEQLVYKYQQAQFFIETPYRNTSFFETLLSVLSPQTLLFIGVDITSPKQQLISKSISDWKKSKSPEINKIPVVFGIYK